MFRNLIIFAAVLAVAIATPTKIDSNLAQKLDSKTNVNIVINFVGGNSKAIQETKSGSFQTRSHRINSLVSLLQSHTHLSQKNVLAFLKSQPVKYKSFWISNQIYVFSANKKLVEYLATFSEVLSVEEERNAYIEPAQTSRNSSAKVEPGWNIKKIQATEAWEITDGSGIVVGNTDSGVRYTHEALRDNYRHEYGWFDAYDGTALPSDHQGHGTHTMGTIAGSLGIGVAPGVKWIACKGCDDNLFCTGVALTACGQWMLCPTLPDGTNPDCSMAPNLVSNSWGYNVGNDPYYERIVEAWIAAGIMPIFAIGNEGPECETVRSPGDYTRVIGVGATTDADATTDFSSIGPTTDGRIKPDVSAPGKDVRSSVNGSDTAYGIWWGTSMATPHVAGVTALLLSVRPDLGFEEVRSILLGGVDTSLSSEDKVCGGITDKTFPNNHFGYGRINALKVLLKAVGSCRK